MDETLSRRVTSSTYHHVDNEYFRIGSCFNCNQNTFHKSLNYRRSSGRTYTIWKCEHCQIESEIFQPVKNEMEIFKQYVQERYLEEDRQGELSEVDGALLSSKISIHEASINKQKRQYLNVVAGSVLGVKH